MPPEPTISIAQAVPTKPAAIDLIRELDCDLESRYPGEPCNGICAESFANDGGVFLLARVDHEPAGCGAVRPYDANRAEIKRMFVRPAFRGIGLGRRLLSELETIAADRGFHSLILETGKLMAEAIALYLASGYREIPRFGDYVESERSVCFQKEIE